MGRKVLISFLGTNPYVRCNYSIEGEEYNKTSNIRYVQEAIVEQRCQSFTDEDVLYFFLTEEAEKRNWINKSYKDEEDDTEIIGLYECMQKRLKGKLSPKIQDIRIPKGKNRAQIWEIFQIVFDVLKDDDQVIFDITYGFRSIPMLGMVLINYARALKRIKVDGIYYGAFENLGFKSQVLKLPMSERNAPIFNLTQFSHLQEWSAAVSVFLEYGITQPLADKAEKTISRFSEKNTVLQQAATDFKKGMETLFLNFSTVRGEEIINGKHLLFDDSMSIMSESTIIREQIPPLAEMLGTISQQLEDLTGDTELDNGLKAVKWMHQNGLVQQGITFLREIIIFYAIDYCGFDWRRHRSRMDTQFFSYCFSYKDGLDEWFKNCSLDKQVSFIKNPHKRERAKNKLKTFFAAIKAHENVMHEFEYVFKLILDYRNDMNHAGLNPNEEKRKTSHEFSTALKESIDGMESLIKKYF